ncbi:MAG: hypothetical protein NWF03_05460 [Candidatus Bathyarchaeota archaeon]|nr:hypothetical protein [Candidatus Bathyarchaeota archaeon]
MTAIPQVPEKIVDMKTIVYKSRVDPATLKSRAEEMKTELFIKRFSKPNPEDIHVVSVDKHYDPYVLVDAKYRIEYYTPKIYTIEVAEKTREVKILGATFSPQIENVPESTTEQVRNVVHLEGEELAFYEDKAYFILDKDGNEIMPDQVPIAPSEENPDKILKEFKKTTQKLKLSDRDIMVLAKTKLVKRPENVENVSTEVFQVTEYATIYNPFYRITFRNDKTKEEKTVDIDGVTGETIR